MTPTQRSLAELRKQGFTPWIVEKWNPFAHVRQDLWGFIDILAIKEGYPGVLGIQCTSDSHVSERVKKSQESANLKTFLSGGNSFKVWGWSKRGKRGEKKVWTLLEHDLSPKPGLNWIKPPEVTFTSVKA